METAREQKLQNGVGGILATTDATPPLTLIFPITRSDCQLQIRHLATALLPDNGQRIQIVAKKEQEERRGQDDLNLARLFTQI